MINPAHGQSVVIGDKRHKVETIFKKMEEDVQFLTQRINVLKQQHSPSEIVLKTYEAMLESRLSILGWLSEYQPTETLSQKCQG